MNSQTLALLGESSAWLDRLSDAYRLPRVVLVRLLRTSAALDREIARWIVDRAQDRARALLQAGERPPTDSDLFSRAIAGCYAQQQRARADVVRAREQKEAEDTDELLRRIKAGEDVL